MRDGTDEIYLPGEPSAVRVERREDAANWRISVVLEDRTFTSSWSAATPQQVEGLAHLLEATCKDALEIPPNETLDECLARPAYLKAWPGHDDTPLKVVVSDINHDHLTMWIVVNIAFGPEPAFVGSCTEVAVGDAERFVGALRRWANDLERHESPDET